MDPAEIIDALRVCGLEPYPYSGRFMYGKQCIGVTANNYDELVQAVIDELQPGEAVALLHELAAPNWDNMARAYVYYWPAPEWPQGKDAPEAEADDGQV